MIAYKTIIHYIHLISFDYYYHTCIIRILLLLHVYLCIYTNFYYHYIYITILTVIQKRIPSFPKASSGTSALREMLRRRVPKPRGKRRNFVAG